ncbi:MAG: hypothetical protein E5X26_07265 [Mesorhizobium sp.]|nr:MAG: hypothetical protein E5X96_06415 [Mesorhizobium sp.]TIR46892.1 MAG: hypothetical protein E5X26_07265 [Mesorhizobium sp.]
MSGIYNKRAYYSSGCVVPEAGNRMRPCQGCMVEARQGGMRAPQSAGSGVVFRQWVHGMVPTV